MANKRATTVTLQNKEYAPVPERIRLFREDTTNGEIKTEQTINPDGTVIVTATVIANLNDPNSKKATGHSYGKISGDKAFEKLETVAVGRALAMLGYLASGEVASAEEMEEFLAYRENLKAETISALQGATDMENLKAIWASLAGTLKVDEQVAKTKEDMKVKFEGTTK